MKQIGFTGTRFGIDKHQAEEVFKILKSFREKRAIIFHHRDCIGSDEKAHKIARTLGYYIIVHLRIISKYRAFCYPENAKR